MFSDRRSLIKTGLGLPAFGMACPVAASSLASVPVMPFFSALSSSPEPDVEISLWPGAPPGAPTSLAAEEIVERSEDPSSYRDRALRNVNTPRLAVFRPDIPNGTSVLVMPGGGYRHVVMDKEGFEFAEWLTARGITAFVLFYRLPHQGWAAGPNVALSDAQRAMRVIRAHADTYSLDPDRVLSLGFSAGGHLCADLATRHTVETYTPVDAADGHSARPCNAAMIYPVISMDPAIAHAGSRERLIGANANRELEIAHSADQNVTASCPPSFLLHPEDDGSVPVENSERFRTALKTAGVPVTTHFFAQGGHGFGLRRAAGLPVANWPDLWHAWALNGSEV